MSSRILLACYGVWMGLLAVGSFAFPDWHLVFWTTLGLSSGVAVLVGIRIHRPRHRVYWVLLSLSLLTFIAGDTTYDVLTDVLGQDNPFPSAADGLYLLMYVLLPASVLGFIRSRTGGRDRGSLLDALTLSAGVGLLSWIFLIVPYVRAADLTLAEKATSIAYPLGDIIVLATLARLLSGGRIRSRAVDLLAAGTAGLLVSDVLYGLVQLNGSWEVGGPVDLGWVLFYAAGGAAALHPSMARLTEPVGPAHGEATGRRLVLLALASLIAPAVLLIESFTGVIHDAPIIAVLSASMFLLVISRLAGVVTTHRQAVARERGLREASAALVGAADAEAVAVAVRTGVGQLLPPNIAHEIVLLVRDAEGLREVGVDKSGSGLVMSDCEVLPGEDGPNLDVADAGSPAPTAGDRGRDSATASGQVGAGGFGYDSIWSQSSQSRTARTVSSRSLDPVLAQELAAFDTSLVCPLALDDRPEGDPLVGVLIVASAERWLAALRDSIQVLASQAALALERIILTSEINRRNSEAYFRTLVHNTADVILILDEENRIRYASPSAENALRLVDLAGVPLLDMIHSGDRRRVHEMMEQIRTSGARYDNADWRVLRSDGSDLQVEVTCRDLREDRTVRGLVLTLRDVTERRRLEQELTHRAFHDSLTGLANRVLFQDRVEHAVARSGRDNSVVGVLFVDLDDFKVVNDTMGHGTGDELLVAVAARLANALRPHDTAARIGGDEFAALIEDATNPAEVEAVAERIMAVLRVPFVLRSETVTVLASIGIGTTLEARDTEELLRQADLALYIAKGAGKQQWRRYQATLHTSALERLEVRASLDQAVADQAFTLRYQPIVDLATGTPVGFEALVRWQHPTRGIVGPIEFIEVAEESGLIVPIGSWVLENALETMAAWRREDSGQRRADSAPLYVSVNASVRQFRAPGFVDQVRDAVRHSGLPAELLVLEITESLLLRDDEQIWSDLTALRDIGIRIAIDDFGTGYSSLSYLRQFPIDILKIDKSFIDDISSPQQLAVVEAIVRLADTLNLSVIAEGVEETAQRDLLVQIGCPLGQGYLFARPMPAADASVWLPLAPAVR